MVQLQEIKAHTYTNYHIKWKGIIPLLCNGLLKLAKVNRMLRHQNGLDFNTTPRTALYLKICKTMFVKVYNSLTDTVKSQTLNKFVFTKTLVERNNILYKNI